MSKTFVASDELAELRHVMLILKKRKKKKKKKKKKRKKKKKKTKKKKCNYVIQIFRFNQSEIVEHK